jgi:phosphoglycerate kinase
MRIPTIPKNIKLKGKRVLVRLDLNEPIENGRVVNDFRMRRALQTLQFLVKSGARVVVLSHCDRPGDSLKTAVLHLNKFIKAGFVPDVCGNVAEESINRMADGSILVLENLRRETGEEKNDRTFARKLAGFGEIYINEAFSVSHRKHASIVTLPKLIPSYAGFLFMEEIEGLSRAIKPKQPLLMVMGGAKSGIKLPLIKKYLTKATSIFVGGALANSFFKEEGYEIGKSFADKDTKALRPLLKNKKIFLPVDVVVKDGSVKWADEVLKSECIVDEGPESLLILEKMIGKSKTIVMNGPLGIYQDGFSGGTEKLLKILAKAKGEVILGGGDTVALVSKLKLEKKFLFVSTGGGAMLDFLVNETLPGIKALTR